MNSVFPAGWSAHLMACKTLDEINAVTDQMASAGLIRPRHDDSRMAEWQAQSVAFVEPQSLGDRLMGQAKAMGLIG